MAGNAPSPRARNTTILFVTVISLLLIFSYYLFVYVPSHEETMHEQHLRVLNKIAQNINSKLGSTINNAKNIAAYTLKQHRRETQEGHSHIDMNELRRNASYFNNSITFEESHGHTDHSFNIHVMEKQYGRPSIHVADYITNAGDTLHYEFSITAENLVTNLLRFDHFEKFAVFTPDRVLHETHPTGSRVKVPFDTLLDADKQVSTSYFREMQYGGLPHVAYFRPIRISDQHNWMLAGFISSDQIAAQKFSLSPLFSIILLLFIILTFLGIPFIKIKIMHVREHLTVKEVIFAFLSVTFILSILML
ncbi:MAG: hypothetical protein R3281_16920, partial [Balneolaceae bacterium]|nr:hypothetical protein [Balneolaceae bacterium]